VAVAYTPSERFEAFCRVADACASRRAVTEKTLAAELTYSVEQGGPETVVADHGDEEDLRSLMLDLRKFMLQEEAASFNTVANLLYQRLNDTVLKDAAIHNRAQWDAAMQGHGVLHDEHGQPVRADHMLDVVLYGGMFHEGQAQMTEWAELDDMYKAMYRVEVTDLVTRCVEIAQAQCALIRKAIDDGSVDLA
jgi:hypothetical protein